METESHHHHHHHHEHGGHHHHHHHGSYDPSLKKIYIFAIALNLLYVVIEAAVGFFTGSMGLLSDAIHNLGDSFSLILALLAFRLATTRSKGKYTYGYRKASVMTALLNAMLLLIAVGAILVESIIKLCSPRMFMAGGLTVSWTAGVGVLINGLTAFLLLRKRKEDLNTEGAFMHMLTDTLVSVGVVISGFLISLTGWSFIDPVTGIIISVVILISTWHLLTESINLSIDAVPEGIDREEVRRTMQAINGVSEVHHIHIWPISTSETALTAHVHIDDVTQMTAIKKQLKEAISLKGIQHITLEFETPTEECNDIEC
ncbi:MAG: cation transporter [Bacteroidales bacterium]|nr:cation transporter [Bacteroidales bacterium]